MTEGISYVYPISHVPTRFGLFAESGPLFTPAPNSHASPSRTPHHFHHEHANIFISRPAPATTRSCIHFDHWVNVAFQNFARLSSRLLLQRDTDALSESDLETNMSMVLARSPLEPIGMNGAGTQKRRSTRLSHEGAEGDEPPAKKPRMNGAQTTSTTVSTKEQDGDASAMGKRKRPGKSCAPGGLAVVHNNESSPPCQKISKFARSCQLTTRPSLRRRSGRLRI